MISAEYIASSTLVLPAGATDKKISTPAGTSINGVAVLNSKFGTIKSSFK